MFAKSVISSARFLRMPATSRLLYYDLGMAADDDGIVEAFTVMRTTGATEDDLRVLVSKEFVTVLNDDFVAYITDRSTNNQIRKDRYHPSIYAELMVKLSDNSLMATTWQPDGNQMESEVRLGKDSIGKVSIGESGADKPPRAQFVVPRVEEVQAYIDEKGYTGIDAAAFVDYYTANGWMVGKHKMKDWKAAVRNWARREKKDDSRMELVTNEDGTQTWRMKT